MNYQEVREFIMRSWIMLLATTIISSINICYAEEVKSALDKKTKKF